MKNVFSEVILKDENNPQYNKVIANRLFLDILRTTPFVSVPQVYELFRNVGIFNDRAIIAYYFFSEKASTPQVAYRNINLFSLDKTYRCINNNQPSIVDSLT